MDVLEIRYENGRMMINVPVFFPCLQKHSRKLSPMIRQHCSGEDKAALGRYLYLLQEFAAAQMERRDGFSGVPPDWDYRLRYVATGKAERQSLYRKADANYRLYCRMEVDDEWMNRRRGTVLRLPFFAKCNCVFLYFVLA